jgi:16S rRNA (uracil1498-N3)-methyltransferase
VDGNNCVIQNAKLKMQKGRRQARASVFHFAFLIFNFAFLMARRRFFAPPSAFAPDRATVMLAADEARHLRDVLRLRTGEEAFVFDGEGREFLCVVEEAGRDEARLSIKGEVEAARPESKLHLTLAVALLKGEKFELVVQKATELGVSRIVPVVTKLADVRVRGEADVERRTLRFLRIALEACKQSGRARLPQIDAPLAFTEFIKQEAANSEAWRVMFAERGGMALSETIERLPSRSPQMIIALVGSEGGWTDEEMIEAREAGWSIVTLGGRILRAETAAIAVAVLLQHLFGDLK